MKNCKSFIYKIIQKIPPFGSAISEMQFKSDTGGSYRYGFNGKETDTETDLQDYGFRIYNPSICKFLSVDPLDEKYPWYTPYQFAGNNPLLSVDIDGLEESNTINETQKTHTVKSGDTYSSLAKQYDVTVEQLRSWNGYGDKNIPVGAQLKISAPTSDQNNTNKNSFNFVDKKGTVVATGTVEIVNTVLSPVITIMSITAEGTKQAKNWTEFNEMLNNGTFMADFGKGKGYKPYSTSFLGGTPQNIPYSQVKSSLQSFTVQASKSMLIGNSLNKITYGLSYASFGISIFQYLYDPSYGKNMGGKKTEFIADFSIGYLGLKGGYPGAVVGVLYNFRIKPMLKAETKEEKEAVISHPGWDRAKRIMEKMNEIDTKGKKN
jgi:RHS repeat-associated protein